RPDNFLNIGLIKHVFPTAKIINTTRNPIDTALSIYFLHFDDSIAYNHSLHDIAHWLGQYRKIMAHWRATYPNDIIDIDYDEIIRDPAPAMARVLDFYDLPWDDSVLNPEHAVGPVR